MTEKKAPDAICELLFSEDSVGYYDVLRCNEDGMQSLKDCIAEEVPIAFVYNGISHVVMLATPDDLEDFALGFSLSEGIVGTAADIYDVEVVNQPNGIELKIEIATEYFAKLKERRRNLTGRTGCGLCGAESLEQALRLPEHEVPVDIHYPIASIRKALEELRTQQKLQSLTGATHASAWVSLDGEILLVREDVGRHNALDKLLGARAKLANPGSGFVVTTSRASYEMVQKVAIAGISLLVAISAPTGLAIRIARSYGVALIGFARSLQYVIYSGDERILQKEV